MLISQNSDARSRPKNHRARESQTFDALPDASAGSPDSPVLKKW